MKTARSVQRYNDNLNRIFEPEIKRLKKCSSVAKEILSELNEHTEIDPCGLEEWALNDLISRVIRKHYFEFN